MANKTQVFVVDTESHGKVLVTVASTGTGAFVSVSPFVINPMVPVMAPVKWVADVKRDLPAMLPD